MAGTLKLGSIPPLSVWHDEVLTFNVMTGLGPGAKFSLRAAPIPAGEMTLDPTSGFFKFAPTAEDRREISIWIRAQKEKNEDIQKFVRCAFLREDFKQTRSHQSVDTSLILV